MLGSSCYFLGQLKFNVYFCSISFIVNDMSVTLNSMKPTWEKQRSDRGVRWVLFSRPEGLAMGASFSYTFLPVGGGTAFRYNHG
jgi:hypothetical protein